MTTDAPDLSDFTGTVTFLGAGAMGGAVLDGFLAAGLPPERVRVTAARERTRARWEERGVSAGADNAEAVRGADVVVLGVKPHLVADVLDEVRDALGDDAIVVSLAAGITLETLEGRAGAGVPVVRVMPNTPALVGEGMFVLTGGHDCSEEQLGRVVDLLRSCGETEVVPEKWQDAASGVSGSGPAYVFYVADALAEGGVFEGLPRDLAVRLAAQTLLGAGRMLVESDTPAATLREQVTSPGGSTAAALRVLDEGAVRHRFSAAVSAATRRAGEMGG
ncbi:pyrroline-5-carboxylate reductase [Mobilicoccus pelagius]|uniref:Pyrroline-5-carboxylate reductase n=1 Tax=Mobilicoccus pelagius NBRC 104925 TaxID=1089455 RepID=H5US37_9MICO|nr:pyrroline-5-carboxylate reductase [Mobilicoccus pelagius]GAB48545.1 pyrroline-5-carboxylate reductase [Mobilicoccus pelagius NBRC 104925]